MTDTTRSGPVRSEVARRKILTATADLLTEHGYTHLSIEAIATRAGVGKQTIYRWWKSKSAILAECLLDDVIFPGRLEIPDTGDIRHDLRTWLQTLSAMMSSEDGEGILRSLIAAATENVEVGRKLHEAITGSEALSARLATATGTTAFLHPDVPVDAVAEALAGALILRTLSHTPLDEASIDSLLAVTLGPPSAANTI